MSQKHFMLKLNILQFEASETMFTHMLSYSLLSAMKFSTHGKKRGHFETLNFDRIVIIKILHSYDWISKVKDIFFKFKIPITIVTSSEHIEILSLYRFGNGDVHLLDCSQHLTVKW
jgi:hypothetical protein